MRTIASLRPFPMRVGNFVGNTIEKAAVLPISIPPRKKYLVYSLFTQGEGFGGGRVPSCMRNHLPQPAQPVGGPLRALVHGPQARQKKGRTPAGSPQPEKVGPGRKNLFLPGVLSSGFLPKKAGPPPGAGRATGRCAPRPERAPHLEGTQYRPASPPRRF